MTKVKYHNNSYIKKFKANILKIMDYKDNYSVILDKTFFYPESGGQLSDEGKIGDVKVKEVIKKDEKILHITEKKPSKTEDVKCFIDWEKRYDYMKQHTGQHILTAILEDDFGYKTESFHMSEDYSSIDIDSVDIDHEEIIKIEQKINKLIWQNKSVKSFWIDPEDLKNYKVRKIGKYNDKIRLIEINDVDISMCGGTHVENINEIGMLKIYNTEKAKKNLTRVYFLCGERALNYYQKINDSVNNLISISGVQQEELVKEYKRLLEENKDLNSSLNYYKEKLIDEKLEYLTSIDKLNIFYEVENIDNKALSYFANQLIENGKKFVSIYDKKSKFLILKQDEEIVNLKELGNKIKNKYNTKGGGNNNIYQLIDVGFDDFKSEIKKYFNKFKLKG